MSSICILTDSTVQFLRPAFPGHQLVNIIQLQTWLGNKPGGENLKTGDLPAYAQNGNAPKLINPDVEQLRQQFINLGSHYNEILAIFVSSHLNPIYTLAQQAAISVKGRVAVQVIDTQTTSIGLGFLVQLAAQAAINNGNSIQIERLLRGAIPHIYSLFCIPTLSYLYYSGFIDHAQSVVGEILGMLPLFSLEEGHLTSVEKARNLRHLGDYFQEFLDEFYDLTHISLIQSVPAMAHEGRTLREHALANFPGTPFSEHPIGLSLATIFGPRSLGVFVIETPESRY